MVRNQPPEISSRLVHSRRQSLTRVRVEGTTNPSLWLDKYLVGYDPKEKGEYQRELIREAIAVREPSWYADWYHRWINALSGCDALCREATVTNRMAVGLGGDSVLETAVTLNPILGVPFIPGSALKGLASSFAGRRLGDDWRADKPGGAHTLMFGDTNLSGYVRFFDALPLPGKSKLHIDTITPHHPEYQKGNGPPTDWDDPVPIPFVAADGKYLIAVSGPEAWASAALVILAEALKADGVGAKTSSGYGRMELELELPKSQNEPMADSIIAQVEALTASRLPGMIPAKVDQWRTIKDENQKKRVAQAMLSKIKAVGQERRMKGKAWYKELTDAVR